MNVTECCDVIARNVHPIYRKTSIDALARTLALLLASPLASRYPQLERAWLTKRMQHSDPVELALLSLTVMRGDVLTDAQQRQLLCLQLFGAA